ncbi:MAG: GAF domain-containing protein [Magnetococcales bacterium]|nr:GAF domain-containing protein [Magnetococcales bacterium]
MEQAKARYFPRLIIFFMFAVVGGGIVEVMDLRSDWDANRTKHAAIAYGLDALDQLHKAQLHFKKQVQEWKDILLRGENDRDSYKKHLGGFFAEEKMFKVSLSAAIPLLQNINISSDVLSALDVLDREHTNLGNRYRRGLESFDMDNAQSYKIVDTMVRGMDRGPTDKMDQLLEDVVTRVKTIINDDQLREMAEQQESMVKVIVTVLLMAVSIVLVAVWNRLLRKEVAKRRAAEGALREAEVVLRQERDFTLWLKNGAAELNERLRGERELLELASQVVSFLATFLGAQAGVFYATQTKGGMVRCGSFALPSATRVHNVAFAPGVGLVGQCMVEKKPIRIHPVPVGYFCIQSGLGDADPRYLLLFPFLLDHKVEAIVELGAFDPFTDAHLEFLTQEAKGIAMAVTAAQSRALLRQALERSQEKVLGLERNSAVMCHSNEELRAQSLQTSEAGGPSLDLTG